VEPFCHRSGPQRSTLHMRAAWWLDLVIKFPSVTQTSSVEEIARLQADAIKAHGKRLGRPLSILEAGCGQSWLIDLTDVEYRLTGIDLDPAALEMRKTRFHDLDDAI